MYDLYAGEDKIKTGYASRGTRFPQYN